MKILLVNPPHGDLPYIPLGLAYIASVLKADGHNVSILDLRVFPADLPHSLRDINLVGITCPSKAYRSVRRIVKEIRNQSPNVPIIVGGPHPTMMGGELLRECPEIDILVIGEGEITAKELVDRLESNRSLDGLKGIVWSKNGKIIFNGIREPIKNLDELPFPARELVPLDKYVDKGGSILTSRGCPYSCSFCYVVHIFPHGRYWRARSPQNVVSEIQHMVENFGIREISIVDDNFTVDRQRVVEICRLIRQHKLDIILNVWNGLRADLIDEELLRELKYSGLQRVHFGAEALDDVVLQNVNKDLTVEQIDTAVKIAKKVGLEVTLLLMVGNPSDSIKTIVRALNFVTKHKIDASFGNVVPYPNTPLYRWVESHARWTLDPKTIEYDVAHSEYKPLFETPEFTFKDRLRAFEIIEDWQKRYILYKRRLWKMKRLRESLLHPLEVGVPLLMKILKRKLTTRGG